MRRIKELDISYSDRRNIRHQLINIFLEEEPGTGTGELCSFYNYYVENLEDGKKIILKRPARLNKGFDFEVHVQDTDFGTTRYRTMPTHRDIIDDLIQKKKENINEFLKAWSIVEKIYACTFVDDEDILRLRFQTGYKIEAIIKTIKWLFIEQDMTYWNWSGRAMFYSGLKNI